MTTTWQDIDAGDRLQIFEGGKWVRVFCLGFEPGFMVVERQGGVIGEVSRIPETTKIRSSNK